MNGQPIVKTYICLYEWSVHGIGVYPSLAGGVQILDVVFDGLRIAPGMERTIRGSMLNALIGAMNGASRLLFFIKLSAC
jgi:hypothetical protein